MRLENVLEGGLFVVKEAVGGCSLVPVPTGRRDAGRWVGSQLRQHDSESIIEALVVQISSLHFLNSPGSHHGTLLFPFQQSLRKLTRPPFSLDQPTSPRLIR